jgi:hypothetical protein
MDPSLALGTLSRKKAQLHHAVQPFESGEDAISGISGFWLIVLPNEGHGFGD